MVATYGRPVGWDRVGGGEFEDGRQYRIERQVIYLRVPMGGGVLPLRLRSYRWMLVRPDGSTIEQATANNRSEIEASVENFGNRRGAPASDLGERLMGLMRSLEDRLGGESTEQVADLLDHNELGLALERMADALCEEETPIASEERAEMLGLVALMGMGGRVERALSFCPAMSD